MLVKNAQNLMEAVIKTMREAEAACMKVTTSWITLPQYTVQIVGTETFR